MLKLLQRLHNIKFKKNEGTRHIYNESKIMNGIKLRCLLIKYSEPSCMSMKNCHP